VERDESKFRTRNSYYNVSWQISDASIQDNCPHQLECWTAHSYTESIQRLRLDVTYVVLIYTLYGILWLHVVIWYHQELYCKRCVVWPTKSQETMHLLYSWRNSIGESTLKERILNEVLACHLFTNVERPTIPKLSSNYISISSTTSSSTHSGVLWLLIRDRKQWVFLHYGLT
jgi:hypothetical protein